ncbi:hypothetical protein GCM10010149_50060 [Nonomuraea roseoviolacea subsp. roseoviolacea]
MASAESRRGCSTSPTVPTIPMATTLAAPVPGTRGAGRDAKVGGSFVIGRPETAAPAGNRRPVMAGDDDISG